MKVAKIERKRREENESFMSRILQVIRATKESAILEGVEHCAICAEGCNLDGVDKVTFSSDDCYNCSGKY